MINTISEHWLSISLIVFQKMSFLAFQAKLSSIDNVVLVERILPGVNKLYQANKNSSSKVHFFVCFYYLLTYFSADKFLASIFLLPDCLFASSALQISNAEKKLTQFL